MLWWRLMSRALRTAHLTVAAAACSVLLAIGMPSATAAPAADSQGYVDSTARCDTPDMVVAFGSTDSSRVAICKTPNGQYEYRGVRLRDGAKLILPASSSGDGKYVADNDGAVYTVTKSSLVVSVGNQVTREESMVDYHEPGTPKAPAGTAKPSGLPPTSATPTTPLPPPLRAEVGGGRGR